MMDYFLFAGGVYFAAFSYAIDSNNLLSAILFRAFPGIIGATLAFDKASALGWI